MNILVTGIHGFVGSNLVVALKERHSLYGLDIVAPEKEGVVKTFSWKDIEPASFPMRNLPEFDAIIHLAGKAHDTKNRSAAQAYFDINMGLTQKIFDFFLESSAKKFVFFSSVKAAADSVVGDMLTEDVVPAPIKRRWKVLLSESPEDQAPVNLHLQTDLRSISEMMWW